MKPLDEKRVEEILRETRRDAPPAYLAALPARVRRALETEARPRRRLGWALASSAALAGALVLAVAVRPAPAPGPREGETAALPVVQGSAAADPVLEDLRALAAAADALAVAGPESEGNDVEPTLFDLNATELAQLERLLAAQGG